MYVQIKWWNSSKVARSVKGEQLVETEEVSAN